MRTLKFRSTYASGDAVANVAVFDIKVQEHLTSTIIAHTTDASHGKLHVFYVFDNDDGTSVEKQIGSDIVLTADTTVITSYDHKIPHMRLKYSKTGGSGAGTVRIDATTAN